jgi:hypothetical protein
MLFLRQFAVPAVLGLSMAVGSTALIGCSHDRDEMVPPSAMMSAEGDSRLSFRAPNDGTVYIYDTDANRLVYSGQVEKGQLLVLDPGQDELTLDGKTLTEKRIDRGDKHQIFFDSSGQVEKRSVTHEETIIKKHSD